GCPHDYDEFREELTPLLENIHGETRHCGKTPRRMPQARQAQSELVQLRRQLVQAINKEAYEEAAQLGEKIRRLGEGWGAEGRLRQPWHPWWRAGGAEPRLRQP